MRKFPLEHKKLMFMFMNMLMLMILMLLVGTKLQKHELFVISSDESLIFLLTYRPLFTLIPPLTNNFILIVFLSSVRHVSVDLPFQKVLYNGQSLITYRYVVKA